MGTRANAVQVDGKIEKKSEMAIRNIIIDIHIYTREHTPTIEMIVFIIMRTRTGSSSPTKINNLSLWAYLQYTYTICAGSQRIVKNHNRRFVRCIQTANDPVASALKEN